MIYIATFKDGTTQTGEHAGDVYNWVANDRRKPIEHIEFISAAINYIINDVYKAFATAHIQEFLTQRGKPPELYCIYAKQTHHWDDEWAPTTPYSYHRTVDGALAKLKRMQDQYDEQLSKVCAEEMHNGEMEFTKMPFEIYPLVLED